VVVPAVDLDCQLELRIGEIDATASPSKRDTVLLNRLGEARTDDGPQYPHLEVALARLVIRRSTPRMLPVGYDSYAVVT
jgi:hypothetical protein